MPKQTRHLCLRYFETDTCIKATGSYRISTFKIQPDFEILAKKTLQMLNTPAIYVPGIFKQLRKRTAMAFSLFKL